MVLAMETVDDTASHENQKHVVKWRKITHHTNASNQSSAVPTTTCVSLASDVISRRSLQRYQLSQIPESKFIYIVERQMSRLDS